MNFDGSVTNVDNKGARLMIRGPDSCLVVVGCSRQCDTTVLDSELRDAGAKIHYARHCL